MSLRASPFEGATPVSAWKGLRAAEAGCLVVEAGDAVEGLKVFLAEGLGGRTGWRTFFGVGQGLLIAFFAMDEVVTCWARVFWRRRRARVGEMVSVRVSMSLAGRNVKIFIHLWASASVAFSQN